MGRISKFLTAKLYSDEENSDKYHDDSSTNLADWL